MVCFRFLEPAAKEPIIPKALEKNIGVIAMKSKASENAQRAGNAWSAFLTNCRYRILFRKTWNGWIGACNNFADYPEFKKWI